MGLIFSDGITKDIDVIEKEKEYTSYILEHITNVNKAFNELIKGRIFDSIHMEFENGEVLDIGAEEMSEIIMVLEMDVKNHDVSKFGVEEFSPYRVKFFPTDTEKKRIEIDSEFANMVATSFQEAWEHHYLNNSHHANYWMYGDDNKLLDTPKDMKAKDVLHMICDWSAMSMKFQHTSSPVEWYEKDADKEKGYMNSHTRKLVEYFLNLLFDAKL